MAVGFHPLCKDCARNLGKAEICFKEWNKIESWIHWIMKDKYLCEFLVLFIYLFLKQGFLFYLFIF